ncbi:ATP-binding protein [Actinacidiphila bryophytorum]|uniref:ATP-binding protein n=1 Tax=Actinacidiphila bryophytorum TaxID=1436133 RepID=UPI002176BB30|nr:ATP-binding protein [Actinacidiphila bryophytorum]UWE08681.1 ATP-binding protein [Actinacidiphila bryophytorum]
MATAGTGAAVVAVPAAVVGVWPRTAASVRRARLSVREAVAAWGMSALADDAALVVGELVTNAVQHSRAAGGEIETRCIPLPRSAGVRIEVHDGDPYGMPALRAPLPDDTGGRGLQLVDAVTRHMWGVRTREGAPGKLIWAHLGAAVSDRADYCTADDRLGLNLATRVLALGGGAAPDLVAHKVLCFLEFGHPGGHFGLVYDHLEGAAAGAVWMRWGDGTPASVAVLADCPAHGPDDTGACSLFSGHVGRHSWEWDF